jgi:hypothetical protein
VCAVGSVRRAVSSYEQLWGAAVGTLHSRQGSFWSPLKPFAVGVSGLQWRAVVRRNCKWSGALVLTALVWQRCRVGDQLKETVDQLITCLLQWSESYVGGIRPLC